MLSSVLDTLRAWPAVRRGTLQLLLPPADAATALVFDGKVAAALRASGYVVRRATAQALDPSYPADIRVLAIALSMRGSPLDGPQLVERIRAEVQRLPAGSWLLLRAPRTERERVAAAFVHAGLAHVAQGVSRRSVLTTAQKRPELVASACR